MELKTKRVRAGAVLPRYAHSGDAGLDLCSVEDVTIGPGESRVVSTGVAIDLPPGTQGEIRPRSGLAMEWGVTVLNSPGTIDQGFRGEIGVVLINHGAKKFCVGAGMRVCQLVVQHRLCVDVVEVEELGASERGSDGFGSTGS